MYSQFILNDNENTVQHINYWIFFGGSFHSGLKLHSKQNKTIQNKRETNRQQRVFSFDQVL